MAFLKPPKLGVLDSDSLGQLADRYFMLLAVGFDQLSDVHGCVNTTNRIYVQELFSTIFRLCFEAAGV